MSKHFKFLFVMAHIQYRYYAIKENVLAFSNRSISLSCFGVIRIERIMNIYRRLQSIITKITKILHYSIVKDKIE